MSKLYVRIDDRLIHGQIVTAWCNTLSIKEIIAIDNELASNPMLQSIMTMGVPSHYKTGILTVEQAKEAIRTPSDKNRLIITRLARVLGDLREELKGCEHINLGNCSKTDDAVYKMASGQGRFVYFSEEDRRILDEFEADNVSVICQLLPSDKVRTWASMKESIGVK
jgi:PTS system mannose-specific IIB component